MATTTTAKPNKPKYKDTVIILNWVTCVCVPISILVAIGQTSPQVAVNLAIALIGIALLTISVASTSKKILSTIAVLSVMLVLAAAIVNPPWAVQIENTCVEQQ
jgi:glucan phosphoethanolaminetransferase (alkaline phosphatase superfamily)